MRKTRVIVEYVETNGSSLSNKRRQKLLALQSEGLERLLVSISPFHNAFINLDTVMAVARDVVHIYGNRGLFPWHTGFLPFLERFSTGETIDVDDYFSRFSPSEIQHQLTSVMYIHPGGRGAYFLAANLPTYPVEAVLERNCKEFLASPVHAHLDYGGNYLTGFCSGLRTGAETGFSLENLYRKGIPLDRYPILEILVQKGIRGLYELALKTGYEPRNEGYVASCHLCLDIRIFLYFNVEKYPELYPHFFYQELRPSKTRF